MEVKVSKGHAATKESGKTRTTQRQEGNEDPAERWILILRTVREANRRTGGEGSSTP